MNRHGWKPVLALTLLVITSACTPSAPPPPPDTRAADEAAIRDLDLQWSKAAQAHDVEATVGFYADDASVLPPNAPIANGKDAIRGLWTTMLVPEVSVSWQAGKVEVARSSDIAYLIGTYSMSIKGPDGTPTNDNGKLVEVWKKQADGSWKVVADIFNSDIPLPKPAAK